MLEIYTPHPHPVAAVGNDYHSPSSSRSTMLPQRSLQKTADSELSIGIDDIASPEPNRRGGERRPSNLSNVAEASERGFGFSLSCWDNGRSSGDLGEDDLEDLPSFPGRYRKGSDNYRVDLPSFQARYKRERSTRPGPKKKNVSSCSNQSIDLDDLTDSENDDDDAHDDEEEDYDTPPTTSPPESDDKLRKWAFRNGRKREIRFSPQDEIHKIETPSIEDYPILYYGVHELQKMMDDFKLEEKQAAEQARIARRGLGPPADTVVFHPPTEGVLEQGTLTTAAQEAAVVARRAVLERHNGARGLSSTD